MAKIRAVDFANSVLISKNALRQLLKDKNIPNVEDDKPLNYYINRLNELPDAEGTGEVEKYVPDKFMADFEEEWKTDPLREANGGEYKYTVFALLDTAFNTTYINKNAQWFASATTPYYIVTSDGQEFTQTSNTAFTITWDVSKDLINEFGDSYRWVKIYTNATGNIPAVSGTYAEFSFKNATGNNNYSQSLMYIADREVFGHSTGTQNNDDYLYGWRKLRYFVIGENYNNDSKYFARFPGEYAFADARSLICIKSLKPVRIYLGASGYNLQHLENISIGSYAGGGNAVFDYLDLSNAVIKSITNTVCPESIILPEEITSLTTTTYIPCKYKTFISLPKIISTNSVILRDAQNLKNIILPSDFAAPLDLEDCNSLKRTTLEYIMSQLKDLTGETAKTITLPQYLYIPQYIKDIAINKNWTVAHTI